MTVLSDARIKALIKIGKLIVDGNDERVRGSSYSCRIEKIYPGGPGDNDQNNQPKVTNWATPSDNDAFRVQPRQLVWVRIREIVALPEDICAFWWQTNTLSRKGLMLVNMSMVDPGYNGPLACLFVNFGREPVDLDPHTTVARLVFHKLEGEAKPFGDGLALPSYDRDLRQVALHGPSSFLSLQEFSTTFQAEKLRTLKEFAEEAKNHVAVLRDELKQTSETLSDRVEAELKNSHQIYVNKIDALFKDSVDNLPKSLIKSYGIAFGGFVLLISAMSIVPWVKDLLSLDVDSAVHRVVQEEIGKRLQPISMVDSDRASLLEQRIQLLEEMIKTKESNK